MARPAAALIVLLVAAAPARADGPPPADAPPPAAEAPPPPAEQPPEATPGEPAPGEPPPRPSTPPAPTGPRLTVHAYEHELPSLSDAVEKAMAAELAGDRRVSAIPFSTLLEAPDAAPKALGQADIDVLDAEQAFAAMDLGKAQTLIARALDAYRRYLPELAARGGGTEPLRDAYIKLAKIHFFDGNAAGARNALRHVFILDPRITFASKLFPAQMRRTVIEARAAFDALGQGSITVESDPPTATVFVNGVQAPRPTPTDPIEAHGGPNFVTLNLRGWAPSTAIVEVAGRGKPTQTLQALSRYPGNPLQPLGRARLQLDKPEAPAALKEAAQALGVDLVALVRFVRTEDEAGAPRVRVLAYLYDVRPHHVLRRVERTVAEHEVVPVARLLAHELLDGTRLDGVWVGPPPPPPPGWRDRLVAFRHSKYFWYVVGGVAGAVVVGAAIGIGVGASDNHGGRAGEQVVLIGGR